MTKYKCGHESEIIILGNNPLSISAYLEWSNTVGKDGTRKLCWACWNKNRTESPFDEIFEDEFESGKKTSVLGDKNG